MSQVCPADVLGTKCFCPSSKASLSQSADSLCPPTPLCEELSIRPSLSNRQQGLPFQQRLLFWQLGC